MRYISLLKEIVKAYLERNGVVAPPGLEPGITGSAGLKHIPYYVDSKSYKQCISEIFDGKFQRNVS